MHATNERHELRPGPAGRVPVGLLIRVILGAVAVYALIELITKVDLLDRQPPRLPWRAR
jgi:hypothetical protein